jgi:protein-glutamine gamma-glutamyltransferase
VKFRLAHKLTSYLLAATGLLTLWSAQIVSPWTMLAVLAVGALSWFMETDTPLGLFIDRATVFFNVLTVALFTLSVLQVARSFPEVDLSPFLNFVLFLLAFKLCQRRSNRDYLQVYILSFLVMLAAAWQATSVFFVVGFFLYVLLATWTLILFHLRREIEENYLVRRTGDAAGAKVTVARVLNSRRVVGRPFFLITGLMAVLVFGGAALVFASVPRVGLGFILGGVRRQTGVAGFSDEVRLGMHGVLSLDNQTVVLRARVPQMAAVSNDGARGRSIASLYWRGTVYDTYENGEWIRSKDERTRTRLFVTQSPSNGARTYRLPQALAPGAAGLADAVEQEIEVVALSNAVAFSLDRPLAIEMAPPPAGAFTTVEVDARWSDELGLRMVRMTPFGAGRRSVMPEFSGARYRAFSRLSSMTVGGQESDAVLALYLRSARSLSPQVKELAERLTRDKPDAAAKVEAVVRWLQATHHYTVDLKRDPSVPDPLEDFLFHQTGGHCEYFASSAALLLRLAGVPTRYVNGFLGGEWNALQGSITVRDNRAHSWIEVYLGQAGWVRVDATPGTSRVVRMNRFRQVIDSLEMLWNRWVIEYNASQQLLLARQLSRDLGWWQSHRGTSGQSNTLIKKHALWAGVAVILLVLAVAVSKLPRRRGALLKRMLRDRGESPVFQLYSKTLDRLSQRGFTRLPQETPHEYLARARKDSLAGAEALGHLTDWYTLARYGEVDIPDEVLITLRDEATSIGKQD